MENINNKFLKEDKIFDRAFKIVEGSNNLDDEFINILDLCEEEEEMESSFKKIIIKKSYLIIEFLRKS